MSKGDTPREPQTNLLERLPLKTTQSEALQIFHHEIARATETFETDRRNGVYQAMNATMEYFLSMGIHPRALRPIGAVAEAIMDADRGKNSQIFGPTRPKRGRPPKSIEDLQFDGKLAAITEFHVRILCSEGVTDYLDRACIITSRLLRSSKWKYKISAEKLKDIRERVHKPQRRSHPERYVYDALMAAGSQIDDPRLAVKYLLEDDSILPPPSKQQS